VTSEPLCEGSFPIKAPAPWALRVNYVMAELGRNLIMGWGVRSEWTNLGGLVGLMKSSYEECRNRADYCELKSHNAITPEIQAAWLRCSADWLSLTLASLKIPRR
jgi:hypothetical protein